jgi:hypothetical protein
MPSRLKALLVHVSSRCTPLDELKANLDEIRMLCEQDYTTAELIKSIASKSDLMAKVARAQLQFGAMIHALAAREASRGFLRSLFAGLRATRACVAMGCAQTEVRIAVRKAEDQKILQMGADPRDPRLAWMHTHTLAETYLL